MTALVALLALASAPQALGATGEITYDGCLTADSNVGSKNGCVPTPSTAGGGIGTGFHDLEALAVSPDARSLYAVSTGDAAVLSFSRNPNTGGLALAGCVTADGPVAGSNGCVAVPDAPAAGAETGFDDLRSVVVSPDGSSVYALSLADAAVLTFGRNVGSGALTYQACFTADGNVGGKNGCVEADATSSSGNNTGFGGLRDLAISPDGRFLYAAGSEAVLTFARGQAAGALAYQACFTVDSFVGNDNGCVQATDATPGGDESGVGGLEGVDLSPDGRSLYVAGADDAVARFTRNKATGALTYEDCFTADSDVAGKNACVEAADAISGGMSTGFNNLQDVEVSHDGRSVYAVSYSDSTVSRFTRNVTTGALTYEGCLTADTEVGNKNNCTQAPDPAAFGTNTGFDGLRGLALSRDGASIYTASVFDDALAAIDRNRTTGALAYDACFTGDLSVVGNSCVQADATGASDTGFDELLDAVVSRDGRSVYAVSREDAAIVRFSREPAPACSDALDNDGDGKTDFPADPGCVSAADNNEMDPPDTTPPVLTLKGKKKQRSAKKVVVKASCDEACTVVIRNRGKARVKGLAAPAVKSTKVRLRLKKARAKLDAGETRRLKLRFKGRAKKKVRRLLKRGKRIKLKLRGKATDAAGNRDRTRFRVKLRR